MPDNIYPNSQRPQLDKNQWNPSQNGQTQVSVKEMTIEETKKFLGEFLKIMSISLRIAILRSLFIGIAFIGIILAIVYSVRHQKASRSDETQILNLSVHKGDFTKTKEGSTVISTEKESSFDMKTSTVLDKSLQTGASTGLTVTKTQNSSIETVSTTSNSDMIIDSETGIIYYLDPKTRHYYFYDDVSKSYQWY